MADHKRGAPVLSPDSRISLKVSKRLDRFFVNLPGRLRWPEAQVQHLPAIRLDHNPIFLKLCHDASNGREMKLFRFEATWLLHTQFPDFVSNSWKAKVSTLEALRAIRKDLLYWNRAVFDNIFRKKNKLLNRIHDIQKATGDCASQRLLNLHEELKEVLYNVLAQEEAL
ncbi:hypothetical protein V2J09_008225 [Rumex salicifolius]